MKKILSVFLILFTDERGKECAVALLLRYQNRIGYMQRTCSVGHIEKVSHESGESFT